MEELILSFNARKSLCVHLNEQVGAEIADLLEALATRIEQLERTKVDVTPISPEGARPVPIRRAA